MITGAFTEDARMTSGASPTPWGGREGSNLHAEFCGLVRNNEP
jgi:hypothetical protein